MRDSLEWFSSTVVTQPEVKNWFSPRFIECFYTVHPTHCLVALELSIISTSFSHQEDVKKCSDSFSFLLLSLPLSLFPSPFFVVSFLQWPMLHPGEVLCRCFTDWVTSSKDRVTLVRCKRNPTYSRRIDEHKYLKKGKNILSRKKNRLNRSFCERVLLIHQSFIPCQHYTSLCRHVRCEVSWNFVVNRRSILASGDELLTSIEKKQILFVAIAPHN